MQTARLLLVMLLVVAPALGESHSDATPREADSGINSTSVSPAANSSTTSYTPIVASPGSLPDEPAPQKVVKVIDKKFMAVMGALAGAEALHFTTHKLVLDHEYAAGAPWVTSVPGNQRLVSKYGAIYAVELLVAYELKKLHPWLPGDKAIRKLWWVYPAAMAPVHIMNGVHSIRTQAPSGCAAAECE